MKLLKTQWKLKHVRKSESFGISGGIWLSGEDDEQDWRSNPIFDYYDENVGKQFETFINKHNFILEWHDPSTLILYPA